MNKDRTPGELQSLSRRERQIMDVIYSLGEATATDVRDQIPDPPSMNAVRRLISILEEKGLLKHKWKGPRHLYFPVITKRRASRSALEHLRHTFFEGSTARVMAALIDQSGSELTNEELDELADQIRKAKDQDR